MQSFLLDHYLWIKSLHVISVIAWMCGMLYLPRLFVYHVDAPKGSEWSETLKVMERKLMRFIMAPAAIATWLFGGLMLYANWEGIMGSGGWMHAKILLVVFMTGFHHMFSAWRKKFARDENVKTAKFFRVWNEVPTLAMIAIVILVIVKPF